ncbi:MAG TPA: STAS domain-containing protein [Ktedonobacteraceae bacterium]|nr:STAS domain-containing protein [Ktedonobacteraceae bacterium]
MQYANPIIHVQPVNTHLDSIEHECFSALSHQLLSSIPTHYNAKTTDTIVLNCSGLESINSHGINLLIMLLIFSQSQQKRLKVFGLSEHNRYIFEITGLSKFIDIVEIETLPLEVFHTS